MELKSNRDYGKDIAKQRTNHTKVRSKEYKLKSEWSSHIIDKRIDCRRRNKIDGNPPSRRPCILHYRKRRIRNIKYYIREELGYAYLKVLGHTRRGPIRLEASKTIKLDGAKLEHTA